LIADVRCGFVDGESSGRYSGLQTRLGANSLLFKCLD
jgi:hypothetical protein